MHNYKAMIILRGYKQEEDEGRLTFAYRCSDLSLQVEPSCYNFNDDLFQSGSLIHAWVIGRVLPENTQGGALYFNVYIGGLVEDTKILNLQTT